MLPLTLPLSPHFRYKLAAQLTAQPVILLDGLAQTAVVVVKGAEHQRALLATAVFMAAQAEGLAIKLRVEGETITAICGALFHRLRRLLRQEIERQGLARAPFFIKVQLTVLQHALHPLAIFGVFTRQLQLRLLLFQRLLACLLLGQTARFTLPIQLGLF